MEMKLSDSFRILLKVVGAWTHKAEVFMETEGDHLVRQSLR
jgi:hypothetical protein